MSESHPDRYAFTVAATGAETCVAYSAPELTFLMGRGCPEMFAFVSALGLWDNFSVARGMNAAAWTVKDRLHLEQAAAQLADRLHAEWPLFSHDYWYRLPGSRSRVRSSLAVELESGKRGALRARYPGHLYVDVATPAHEIVDLRGSDSFVAAGIGTIQIYRKPNRIRWPSFLATLLAFLRACDGADVRVRHHYAAVD